VTLPAFRTWGRLLFACFVMVLAHQAVAADAPWPQAVDLASVEDEFPLRGS